MRRFAFALVVSGAFAGCNAQAPLVSTPLPPAAGNWSGNVVIQSQVARMTWALTQNGGSVVGPVRIGDPAGAPVLNGYLTGAFDGSTLTYSISVPAGDLPSAPACAGRLEGKATLAPGRPSTLTGRYAFSPDGCGSGLSSGTFILTNGIGSPSGSS